MLFCSVNSFSQSYDDEWIDVGEDHYELRFEDCKPLHIPVDSLKKYICGCFQDDARTEDSWYWEEEHSGEAGPLGFYFLHQISGVNNTNCFSGPQTVGETGVLKNMSRNYEQLQVRKWFEESYSSTVCHTSKWRTNDMKLAITIASEDGYTLDASKLGECFFENGFLIRLIDHSLYGLAYELVMAYPKIDFTLYRDPCSDMTVLEYIESEKELIKQDAEGSLDAYDMEDINSLDAFAAIFKREFVQEKSVRVFKACADADLFSSYNDHNSDVLAKDHEILSDYRMMKNDYELKEKTDNACRNFTHPDGSLQMICKTLGNWTIEYTKLYTNGQAELISKTYRGKHHGEARMYYESGELKGVVNFEYGRKVGEAIFYYESGAVMEKYNFTPEGYYGEDILDGDQYTYYENGNIRVKKTYSNFAADWVEYEYDNSGNLTSQTRYHYGKKVN